MTEVVLDEKVNEVGAYLYWDLMKIKMINLKLLSKTEKGGPVVGEEFNGFKWSPPSQLLM